MSTISEPTTWNRTLYRGTDHEWTFRRIDENGAPIIPTVVSAQIRQRANGPLWFAIADIDIDETDGWVTLTIPRTATEDAAWSERTTGVYDVEVIVAGKKYRWLEGRVTVSQDVTR